MIAHKVIRGKSIYPGKHFSNNERKGRIYGILHQTS